MHLNFDWTVTQVIWTLTFAALLVLLVVLLGRERYKRFKMFSIGLVLLTFRMLALRLLYQKMAPLGMYEIFIPLALLSGIVGVLVVVEMARRAFDGLERRTWLLGTLAVVAVGAAVVGFWGTWPAWKTVSAGTTLAVLGLIQVVAQKTDLLVNVITVELMVLVLLFGRRYKAAWRSHVQAILIGLSAVSIGEMLRDGILQLVLWKSPPHNQAEYQSVIDFGDKLSSTNQILFLVVVVWWIARLWVDEPGGGVSTPVGIEPAAVGTNDEE